jgi:uncharacterized membrane protein
MKVLNMTLSAWLFAFAGSGLVGIALKLKGTRAWGLFLAAWILIGTIVYRLTGIQTHPGYYLGVEQDPQYPDLKNGFVNV